MTRMIHSRVKGAKKLLNPSADSRTVINSPTPQLKNLPFTSFNGAQASRDKEHQKLHHVLKSCKLHLDSATAIQTHARIVTRGYGTYPSLLASLLAVYKRCGCVTLATQLVDQIVNSACGVNYFNLVIESLMRNGECDIAKRVFRKVPNPDLVTWNTVIGGCVRNERFQEALGVFRKLVRSGLEPDGFTFSSVITACARLGALHNAQRVHCLMMKKRIEMNFILSAALIDMYSKCGRVQTAREIFGNVRHDDVSVWNAMINGLAIHGLALEAIEMFSKMEIDYVLPDSITFVAIMKACGHCNLVEEGRKYFDLMTSRYSIQPEIEHYGAMVDLLGRAGLLEEAYATIKAMAVEPDVVIWRALLSACRTHRNPELGEVAIANMSRPRSGDYVLLSNTYCSIKKWDSAERVREMMKKKRVRKNQGKSWLELEGVIHQFRAGDQTHPEMKSIYRVLEALIKRTKSEGFVPVTELVLMDVSEEEKEGNLNSHSEKLALAYGILKTSPGTEIRISKNLRICHDCHCWIKLVSRLLNRVIIVRDRIRFHHFEGGMCLCGDYW
ncbi:PREDICTED: pentatricopeptide repeat-containing protein At5g50990-like [Fragaria vesca subsp. vesca]|uniref:pentatricopeptide repeat-containing protein At5g50990 n=1 Tax=Fragaria vesca subsp. vesca TaxID=101020 RepID=UPI0002C31093|nr:PREDICTED: pentatricopeptide repeat-containing protein At5g50990 [Fragaria vesca subsp. vesca]XP_011465266.1 PREDICTED: pentatricopeptide repeat-containing protein At5g50990 [Fragaria vesca subsp. vesca]